MKYLYQISVDAQIFTNSILIFSRQIGITSLINIQTMHKFNTKISLDTLSMMLKTKAKKSATENYVENQWQCN